MLEPTLETITIAGTPTALHSWTPKTSKATVVVYHGFLAHARYPTVRYAAELLFQNGFTVVAADMMGHGQSEGLKGYLKSSQSVIDWGVQVAQRVKPQFLLGSSMGGTIACCVARQVPSVKGICLLAPMLQLSVSSVAQSLLWGLSHVIPTAEIIPSSSTSAEKQYRDAERRNECEESSTGGGNIRVASAYTCVSLTNTVQQVLPKLTCPILCMIADEDVVVSNDGIQDMLPSQTTVQHYAALHGLLCEPEPLRSEIEGKLLQWLQERC